MRLTDVIKWQQPNKYTPECIKVFVGNIELDLSGTMIKQDLFCGNLDKAEQEIKKLWRKNISKEKAKYYYFRSECGKFSFTVHNPFFAMYSRMGIKERLKRYQDLKKLFSADDWLYNYGSSAVLNGAFEVEKKQDFFIKVSPVLHIGYTK